MRTHATALRLNAASGPWTLVGRAARRMRFFPYPLVQTSAASGLARGHAGCAHGGLPEAAATSPRVDPGDLGANSSSASRRMHFVVLAFLAVNLVNALLYFFNTRRVRKGAGPPAAARGRQARATTT